MQTPKGARNPMRARFRERVRKDVKAAALRQIAVGGACAVSINAIAGELGVSGPALYRYFANRDELLEDLVLDTYHDLADALAAATDRDLGQPPQDRLRAGLQAWRSFALAEPHRYRLLYAPPVPGYDAHTEPIVCASNRIMDVGLDLFSDLAASSKRPTSGVPASSLETGLSAVAGFPQERISTTAGSEELLRVISAWTWLHGFVSLEIGGNFSSMNVDADAMFRHEVDALIQDHDQARDPS